MTVTPLAAAYACTPSSAKDNLPFLLARKRQFLSKGLVNQKEQEN
ncbi:MULTISPECIES: hypothetical protein [Corynebacterium]|nr:MULTISPECIES: hypothetical protein [Corynebacterium]